MSDYWIAKVGVTLTRYSRKSTTPVEKEFDKGTKFKICKSKRFPDIEKSNFWKFEAVEGGCGPNFRGYACRYYFHPEYPECTEEEYLWFMGSVPRAIAMEFLLNDINGNGAYLIRMGSKNRYTLSLKVHEGQGFRVAHYQIKREDNKNNKGKFLLETDHRFIKIEDLLDHYRNQRSKLPTELSEIVLFPSPAADEVFQQTLQITTDKNIWEIPKTDIKKDEQLGSGNFGEVYKGKLREKVTVAIKVLKEIKDEDGNQKDYQKEAEAFKKENEIMRRLNHPCLVKMFGISVDTQPFMLVMEFCEKGAIKDYLEKFCDDGRGSKKKSHSYSPQIKSSSDSPKFEDMREWCEQIAEGMQFLESKNIIHRDLAARNVMLNKHNRAKIADFGLAYEEGESTEGAKFPVLWTAPEIVVDKKTKGRRKKDFSHKSDVWSFGVTMWEIFSFAEKPYYREFHLKSPSDVKKYLKEKKTLGLPQNYLAKEMEKVQKLYDEVMKPCWKYKPEDRPNFESLYDSLAHFEGTYGVYDQMYTA